MESRASGIQVWLFPTHASSDVSYWHAGEQAEVVWRHAWAYVAVLEREAGARAYDPRLDRVLDLRADFDAVLAQYAGGMQTMEEIRVNPRARG